MRTLILKALLFAGTSFTFALEGGYGYFAFQVNILGARAIEDKVEAKGYPAPASNCLDLVGGGSWIYKRFAIEIEGGDICGGERKIRGKYESAYEGSFLILSGWYQILRDKKNMLTVGAGLGAAALSVNVRDRGSRNGDFFTHYIAQSSGTILKGDVSYVRKAGKVLLTLHSGALQPLTGLTIEGQKLGTSFFIRLGLGFGYWM